MAYPRSGAEVYPLKLSGSNSFQLKSSAISSGAMMGSSPLPA